SRLRGLAGLEPVRTASPVDFLWFRLPRHATDPAGGVYVGDGGWIALLDRGAEWQVGYSVAEGAYTQLRARGSVVFGAPSSGECRGWPTGPTPCVTGSRPRCCPSRCAVCDAGISRACC